MHIAYIHGMTLLFFLVYAHLRIGMLHWDERMDVALIVMCICHLVMDDLI